MDAAAEASSTDGPLAKAVQSTFEESQMQSLPDSARVYEAEAEYSVQVKTVGRKG